jgi:hypothetical protein
MRLETVNAETVVQFSSALEKRITPTQRAACSVREEMNKAAVWPRVSSNLCFENCRSTVSRALAGFAATLSPPLPNAKDDLPKLLV